MVALIPARAGSKRCVGKNVRLLAGHPLIAYTIAAAKESGVFDEILVCSDDSRALEIAVSMGVGIRQRTDVADSEPDIVWVRQVLDTPFAADAFAILRPTSPFRSASDIRAAATIFKWAQPCDSLRAVRRVREHPGKMWASLRGHRLVPLLPYYTRTGNDASDAPWHSAPTQTLTVYYVQTSSLEMAWTKTVRDTDTIAGSTVIPFLAEGYGGLAIDTEADFENAERIARAHPELLPAVAA